MTEEEERFAFDARMAARRWRWRPEIGRWFIGMREEVYLDGEWQPAARYVTVALMSWQWCRDHMYYNGPHDAIHAGWLALCWSWDWCCECMPCDADECAVCGWMGT